MGNLEMVIIIGPLSPPTSNPSPSGLGPHTISKLLGVVARIDDEATMAGLLAWAADVVAGGGHATVYGEEDRLDPVVFTAEQRDRAAELERRAAALRRSIHDLRLRIPPDHISQRLPHLHAHSLASSAALELQMDAHSATREQAQLRAVTLQEENAAYEKAISICQKKIQEKQQEAGTLQIKLQEAEMTEKQLRYELEQMQRSSNSEHSIKSVDFEATNDSRRKAGALEIDLAKELDAKKKTLSNVEGTVQTLQNKWAQIQQEAMKKPLPAQRERYLDKQLQNLIEQLSRKQAQAESLISEIHAKELELDTLDGLRRKQYSGSINSGRTRSRFGRSGSGMDSTSSEHLIDPRDGELPVCFRMDHQQKRMVWRSMFVLYIFFLHLLVFIKISF